MNRVSGLFLFVTNFFFLLSCQPTDLSTKKLAGKYYNKENAEDFSKLILRPDSTYEFIQSRAWSCDLWRYYYGSWNIENNRICLMEGHYFTDSLKLVQKENFNADTLIIRIDTNLIQQFPDLKLRINLSDYPVKLENGIAKIFKPNHIWDYIKKDWEGKEVKGKYYSIYSPLELQSGIFFAQIRDVFKNETIDISLKNQIIAKNSYEKVVSYKMMNDSLLISKVRVGSILKNHILIKSEN